MEVLINNVVDTFIKQKDFLLNGGFQYKDILSACDSQVKDCVMSAKETAKNKIFNNSQKLQLEIGSYTTIEILLDSFIKAAYVFQSQESDKSIPYKYEKILELMKGQKPRKNLSLYHSYMHVLDFISGMTDNYATHIAKQLRGIYD